MSGVFAPRQVLPRGVAQGRMMRGITGHRQAPKPVAYKKDADDRINEAADKFKQGADDAKDSLKGWRKKGESHAEDAKDTADRWANKAERTTDSWANKAENKAEDAKDTMKSWANKAGDKAEDAKDNVKDWANRAENKAEEYGDRAKDSLRTDESASTLYSFAALAMLVLEVYKIWRPEAAVARIFGFAMHKFGSEVAALMGQLGTAPFLMQAMGVLSIPAIAAFLNQAQQAREGNLLADSSMRLNFGLGVWSFMSAFALFTSPLFQNMGGPAIAWASSVLLLSLFAVIKGTRLTEDFGTLTQRTLGGIFGTLKRALTPSTLEGAVYGIFFVLTTGAVISTSFGNAAVGDMFGAGIASLVPAHREVINLLSRAISAQLIFISVVFATLKELADKKALASPTARLMNLGMTLMLIGFGVLARGGAASGIYSEMGSKLMGTVGTIASAMLVATGIFTIYPESKSEITEDTERYAY